MAKLDPKQLKKVKQSELIQAAKIAGVKNAEKVSKEALIPAFMKAMEALAEEELKLLEKAAINMYNELVKIFNLEEPTAGGTAGEGLPSTSDPKNVKKGAKGKVKKTPKPKKEKKERYTGTNAVIDAIKEMRHSFTMSSLLEKANKIYSEKTGKKGYENLDRRYLLFVPVAIGLGIAKQDGEKITVSK
jgi:hypothetical protein